MAGHFHADHVVVESSMNTMSLTATMVHKVWGGQQKCHRGEMVAVNTVNDILFA